MWQGPGQLRKGNSSLRTSSEPALIECVHTWMCRQSIQLQADDTLTNVLLYVLEGQLIVRSFPTVNFRMSTEVRPSAAGFPTLASFLRPCWAVKLLGFQHSRALIQDSPTFASLVRPASAVLSELVALAKEFPAVTALEGSFAGVNSLVLSEAKALAKESPTVTAFIRPGSCVDSMVLNEGRALAK